MPASVSTLTTRASCPLSHCSFTWGRRKYIASTLVIFILGVPKKEKEKGSSQYTGTILSPKYIVRCAGCKLTIDPKQYRANCLKCGGPLLFDYSQDLGEPALSKSTQDRGMWKYASVLPVEDTSKIVSLGEGNTPLIRSRLYPDRNIFLKNETTNPTGSHKDRSLSIAITKAVEFGFEACMLYSDGSAALSSAAYAARAGISNINLTAAGAPDSRLLPLMIYGSTILEYQGNDAEALDWVHQTCEQLGIYETTTYRRANPYGAEGPKTISYEIFEALSDVPDVVVVPVGGGGTLSGIWQGFIDLKGIGFTHKLPRLIGVLPYGYKLLELGLQEGAETDSDLKRLANFEVPASGQVKLAMSFPPDGLEAIASIRNSAGQFLYAPDSAALNAQRRLGAVEGVYAEMSASVAVVAIDEMIQRSLLKESDTVVGVVCGSGFRETGELARNVPVEKILIYPDSKLSQLESLLAARTARVRRA
jgi:threonine synthase